MTKKKGKKRREIPRNEGELYIPELVQPEFKPPTKKEIAEETATTRVEKLQILKIKIFEQIPKEQLMEIRDILKNGKTSPRGINELEDDGFTAERKININSLVDGNGNIKEAVLQNNFALQKEMLHLRTYVAEKYKVEIGPDPNDPENKNSFYIWIK